MTNISQAVTTTEATQQMSIYDMVNLIIALLALLEPWIVKLARYLIKRFSQKQFKKDTIREMERILNLINGVSDDVFRKDWNNMETVLENGKSQICSTLIKLQERFYNQKCYRKSAEVYKRTSLDFLYSVEKYFQDSKSYCETDITKNSMVDVVTYARYSPNYYGKNTLLDNIRCVNSYHMKLIHEKWKLVCIEAHR